MAKYRCSVCGWVYDEREQGKAWGDVPDDYVCPVCDSKKAYFQPLPDEDGPKEDPAPPKV